MARFGVVQVFGLGESPALGVLVPAMTTVSEVFAEGLRQQGVDNRHSELRIFLDDGPVTGDVVVEVHDVREGFESARAEVPGEVADLSLAALAWLALDVVTAAVQRLGELRGWEADHVHRARAHAVASGLVFRWSTPWKSSPSRRRRRARATFWVDRRSLGRVVLEICDADDEVIARSGPETTHPTPEDFHRRARTLRWHGDDTVTIDRGALWRQPVVMSLAVDGGLASPPDPGLLDPASAGVVRPSVALLERDPSAHEVRVVGGGPTNDVPDAYSVELDRLFEQLHGPDWLRWWAPAELRVLEVWWEAWADRDAVVARKVGDRLVVKIKHTTHGFDDRDPEALARADVREVGRVAAARMRLGPAPDLI